MDSLKIELDESSTGLSLRDDRDRYYRELTRRNAIFIAPDTQEKLGAVRMLIAGCGSTGGACIESLARVGVRHFALADLGTYELNNMNRQHAFIDDLGKNKAAFHSQQVLRINPHAEVRTETKGIQPENVEELVRWADLVMDAVDVTTSSGIEMKLLLHEVAKRQGKPVFTALDMGFCQWGKSYDYRDPRVGSISRLFSGNRGSIHPLKALFTIVPLSVVPTHCLRLVRDMLLDPELSASQLGCASDLLSAIIVPAVVRYVETGEVVDGWNIDLYPIARGKLERLKDLAERPKLLSQVRILLSQVS